MSESLIISLFQLGFTVAGFVGLAAVANYRIGRLEDQRREDREDREKAFGALAEALATVTTAIARKSEDAAREHQEFRSDIKAVSIRQDDQCERMNDHGRRLDDQGIRITRLEVKGHE